MLLAVQLDNPLLWALVIGWILSVTLHEFAHGFVANLGCDYTIRERGGITLNPLHYVDPVMSLILPVIFLLMGGIALPGGATYVRTDLLRNRGWISATFAAGPAMNLLLFLVLAAAIHPKTGWINYSTLPNQWTNAQIFLSALAYLQLLSVFLNLAPVPGLDGFGLISPFLKEELRHKLTTPPLSSMLMFGYFLLLWRAPGFIGMYENAMDRFGHALGLNLGFAKYSFIYAWQGGV